MRKQVYKLIITASLFIPFGAHGMNVSFISNRKVLTEIPPKSTGLSNVYIVYNIADLSRIEFLDIDTGSFKLQRFSNLGGGFAEEVELSYSEGKAVYSAPRGDCGYIVTEGDTQVCFWIVDYTGKEFGITSIEESDLTDCDRTVLSTDGRGAPIIYYSVAGKGCVLDRGIEVNYTNLLWDEKAEGYQMQEITQILPSLESTFTLTSPLYCNSRVTVRGDRFQQAWGEEKSAESTVLTASGVGVHTRAHKLNEESATNVIGGEDGGLGGSAPVKIEFMSESTDAVIHNEWQLAEDQNFEKLLARFNDKDLTYTFDQEGNYFVRFIGSNSDGSCQASGDTYSISIGSSDLRIPNAFSPDDDGVNDIWKVGYRSIVEFKCWIFDRNGKELYYFDSPSGGWDGTYKGKKVSPGVYYYVIEALGADNKVYKKGGDINIILYKRTEKSSN